jgi:hypothetical protein
MRSKLPYQFVKDFIEQEGYQLLSSEYVSVKTKLDIQCSNGHPFSMKFNNFQQGQRCPTCSLKQKSDKLKHTFEYVKSFIENVGYVLLSTEYHNNKEKITIQCNNGHIFKMTFGSFKHGTRCPKCSIIRNADQNRLTYQYVKDFIEQNGYTLLSTDYMNVITKLDVMCDKGHKYNVKFNDFQQGRRCPVCKKINTGNRCRTPYNQVKKLIEDNNYQLLSSTYLNAHTKLSIKCPVGHIFEMGRIAFKHGQRCPQCYKESITNNNRKEFDEYRRQINNLTEKNYKKFKNIINPNNLKRGRNKYHLDHKYSVYDGFINKIEPEIIASVNNLQMMLECDNISKHKNSEISLNDLFKGCQVNGN